MLIKDNFLPEEEFQAIKQIVMSNEFAWFYNKTILSATEFSEEVPFQFTHLIFDNKNPQNRSPFYSLFEPIYDEIGITELIRAKINLGVRTSKNIEGGWHTDTPESESHKTAVVFFNTNNGHTKFEDGTVVESVENRFAEFDSNLKHTGVSHTDSQVRVVLNLNYLAE